MTEIIGAPTVDDALIALGRAVQTRQSRGEKTLIFCEDRLTLLAERAVLSVCGGTFLTEVTTFARYLSGPKVLSKEGSVLEISSLLSRYEKELNYFRPRAAQAVYETIAQLSASRVDAETLRASAEASEGALKGKLSDLALIMEGYTAALRERGLLDENGYLALLPEKFSSGELIGVNVIFFGFRSFTKQALEGVRAALLSAQSVTGIFLAGRAELYTNEAAHAFRMAAEEVGEITLFEMPDSLGEEAKRLRDALFSPEKLLSEPLPTAKVHRFSAADEAEEFATVAALIRKHVFEGARYQDIVLLVSGKESFPAVEKAFNSFHIPFFADKKRPYVQHPFCTFLLDILLAVSDGVLPEEADAIASNYYFGDGDEYRNYLLQAGGWRGAVRREIKEEKGFHFKKLCACRERMLGLLKRFPRKGKGAEYAEAIRTLKEECGAEQRTEELQTYFTGAEREFLDLTPLENILLEIQSVAGERVFTAREFYDALKSALTALEISMIPQFLDAVYVGELADSKFRRAPILFACGLTGAVPPVSHDTALITDREMEGLAAIKVEIEPAIAQVNARARESVALNLCAFGRALYLSYPLRKGKEDAEPSEIFTYVEKIFNMPPNPELFPFDCCERQPATLKMLSLRAGAEAGRPREGGQFSALVQLLGGENFSEEGKKAVPLAGELAFSAPFSPTLLEKYFECPYAGFALSLRLRERQERMVLSADTGTFLHAVLEESAKQFNSFTDEAQCRTFARERGEELLRSRFSALSETAQGRYTAARLLSEAETVTAAAYRQLALSAFRVRETEKAVSLPDLFLAGKTDRIDDAEGFVRIIDYKTGEFDSSAVGYYTGRSLQLQLYLRAASEGGRAAGAFYFPAAEGFSREGDAPFRMEGFYCGDEEVLRLMDPAFPGKGKSLLFNFSTVGNKDKAMSREDFEHFLDYAVLLSKKAEEEIRAGNLAPSPYEGSCRFCKLKSLCGFTGTPRREREVNCAAIAAIVRREKEGS